MFADAAVYSVSLHAVGRMASSQTRTARLRGNLYQVQAYGRGTNLHAVWDTLLVAQWPGGVPALRATVEAKAVAPGKTDLAAWAEASCRIVATEGFYPAGHRLEPHYRQCWGPVIEIQLAAAARRLADALNDALETPK